MKTIYTVILSLFVSCVSNAQLYVGVQNVGGSFTGISPYYASDSYNMMNYPTFKADIWANNELFHINASGLFYWIGALKVDADGESSQGVNVTATTNKGMHKIQDRVGLEFVKTKFTESDGPITNGKGWQFGFKRFGMGNGFLKTSIPDSVFMGPDNGPYYQGNVLTAGFNIQRKRYLTKALTIRSGLYINGMAGIMKFGGQVYPKVTLEAKVKFLAIRFDAQYEINAYYGITQKAYRDFYVAKNFGLVNSYRFELSVGIDLKSDKK